VPQFPFPVGVLLFNRPEYAEKTLRGLADQTMPVAGKRVVIVIDGYSGSKAEKNRQADRTAEVEAIARAVFPDAHISISPHNVGIAHAFDLLEKALRDCDPKAEWYGFFEEDYVPNSTYLATIAALATQATRSTRIAAVSATGEIFGEVTRGADSVYPLSRLWAFLMRASHLDERRSHIDGYLAAVAENPYWQRDKPAIARALASMGVLPIGVSQDQVKLSLLAHFDRYGISTGSSQGEYIGVIGEHMTEKSFARFGFSSSTSAPFDASAVSVGALEPDLHREARIGFASKVARAYVIPRYDAFSARLTELERPRLTRALGAFARGFRILRGRHD